MFTSRLVWSLSLLMFPLAPLQADVVGLSKSASGLTAAEWFANAEPCMLGHVGTTETELSQGESGQTRTDGRQPNAFFAIHYLVMDQFMPFPGPFHPAEGQASQLSNSLAYKDCTTREYMLNLVTQALPDQPTPSDLPISVSPDTLVSVGIHETLPNNLFELYAGRWTSGEKIAAGLKEVAYEPGMDALFYEGDITGIEPEGSAFKLAAAKPVTMRFDGDTIDARLVFDEMWINQKMQKGRTVQFKLGFELTPDGIRITQIDNVVVRPLNWVEGQQLTLSDKLAQAAIRAEFGKIFGDEIIIDAQTLAEMLITKPKKPFRVAFDKATARGGWLLVNVANLRSAK